MDTTPVETPVETATDLYSAINKLANDDLISCYQIQPCKENNCKIKTSTICCYPTDDNFILAHKNEIIKNYHPYNDGQSAKRMVDAVENYLKDNKVPNTRKISIFRMLKTLHKILAKKI